MRPSQFSRWMLAAVSLCFIVRGAFYCAFMPLWEGFDEWAHFGVVQQMVNTNRLLVGRTEPLTREVWASMNLAPAPANTGKPFTTEDEFWKLSPEERRARAVALNNIPLSWSKQAAEGASPIYEALQPPLYYWIISVPYWLADRRPLLDRVFILRCAGLLIASFAIPILYRIANRVFRNSTMALLTICLAAVLPELMIDVCRAGNECLGIVLFSWLTLLLLPAEEERQAISSVRAFWTGVALGLGLLTKAYFLTAIPAVLLIYLARAWHMKRVKTWFLRMILTFGIAALIAGWWYIRNRATTGTWSGLLEAAKLVHYTLPQFWRGAMEVDWRNAVDSIVFSHIWFGGWSSLQVRSWMYHLLYLVIAACVIGVLVALRTKEMRRIIFPLGMIYALFWLGQLYNVVLLFLTKGASTSMGWYMYCVIAAEVLLLVIGIHAAVSPKFRGWTLSVFITLIGALDLYSVSFISIPYYTGLTSHRAGGAVAAFHWSALSGIGVAGVEERLSMMKTAVLTPAAQGLAYLLFVAATLLLIALPYWLSKLEVQSEVRQALPRRRKITLQL